MKIKRLNIIFLILTLVMMALIFVLSSQQSHTSYQLSENFSRAIKADMMADDGTMISPDDEENYTTESDESTNVNYYAFGIFNTRKLAHMLLYFVLGFFTYLAIPKSKIRLVAAFFIDYMYACTDEIHQHFVGRTGAFTDTLYDAGGIILSLAICLVISRIISKKYKKRTDVIQ